MKVGIVGAGVAGLATAKVLAQLGHEVAVYDRSPDVGGVWSSTRRYPGVTTQSPRDAYALSDFPMPADLPEWPTGEQVQAYLAGYAAHFGLLRVLHLSTEVDHAAPCLGGGWELTVRDADGQRTERVDHVVVANGIFSEPDVPAFEGLAEFGRAGGRLVPASALHDAADVAGAHVVVVGYGKSALDCAVAVSGVAARTTVVARQLLWKVPRRIAGVVNFKFLLLTRLGEGLFRYVRLRGVERFLHGPGNGLRRRMLNSLGTVSVRQYGLKRLGLVPLGRMEDIVRGAIGLTTDGFFEAVAAGQITVHRDTTVTRLLEVDGVPSAELADGSVLRADVLVCATGYRQGVPFLDEEVRARLTDERGSFLLYRQVHPVDVADLSFAGYNSSFFSPLSAEMAAVWIAARLGGQLVLPDPAAMRRQVREQVAFMDEATGGHHAHNTKVIPFSLHNIDELLDDLDLNLPPLTRAGQWLNPVDPRAYRSVTERLVARSGRPGAPMETAGHPPAARADVTASGR